MGDFEDRSLEFGQKLISANSNKKNLGKKFNKLKHINSTFVRAT